MRDCKLDTTSENQSGLSQHALERQAEKPEAQGILLLQRNPLAQMTSRVGNAASASAHAATLNRATTGRPSRAGHSLLQLQRQYGNRYVQRVLALAKKGDGEAEAARGMEQTIQRARGGGQALDSGVRAQMEPALGADFGGVRVHTGSEADALNHSLSARAFTTGQDIFFRQGAYNPGNSSGQELLAHELTHVVQQNGDQVRRKLTIGQPGDKYEQEADQVARAMMQREQQVAQRRTGGGLVRRQVEEEEEEETIQTRAEDFLIQRQAEEEEEEEEPIQAKAKDGLVQRQMEEEEEEEPLRAEAEVAGLRRQVAEEEEEPIQAKDKDGLVQRQMEEEEEEKPVQAKAEAARVQRQAEEEEEPIQARAEDVLVQRQVEEEEEESIQARAKVAGIQGQVEEEEEEEPVQTKAKDAQVQRQAEEEEEEPIQAQAEDGLVQRQVEEDEEESELVQTRVEQGMQRLVKKDEAESIQAKLAVAQEQTKVAADSLHAGRFSARTAILRSTETAGVSNRLYSKEVLEKIGELEPGEIAQYLRSNGLRLPKEIELKLKNNFEDALEWKRDLDAVVFKYEHGKGTTTTIELLRFQLNGLLCYEIQKKKRRWRKPRIERQTYYNAQGEKEKVTKKEASFIREVQEWRIRHEEQERRIEERLYSKTDLSIIRKAKKLKPLEISVKLKKSEKIRVPELRKNLNRMPDEIELEQFKKVPKYWPKRQAFRFRDQEKKTTKLLRFLSNGLLRYEVRYEEGKSITYYDATGKTVRKEGALAKRQRLKQRLKYGEQEQEIEKGRAGLKVQDIWQLTNPDRWLQTTRVGLGVTSELMVAYKKILKELNTLEFDKGLIKERTRLEAERSQLDSGSEEYKILTGRINRITFYENNFWEVRDEIALAVKYMEALEEIKRIHKKRGVRKDPLWFQKKRKRIWAQETKVEKVLAPLSATKLCNVISYYLFGVAIGKIPKDKLFSDYFIEEIQKGHISVEKGRLTEIEAPYLGSGSGAWREDWEMDRLVDEVHLAKPKKVRHVPITNKRRREQLTKFFNSGVRLANSWQDLRGKGRPHHFLLIVKDKNGVWRNMDHTSRSPECRGGYTNWNQVYGLYYGKASDEEKQFQVLQFFFGKDWTEWLQPISAGGQETEQEAK